MGEVRAGSFASKNQSAVIGYGFILGYASKPLLSYDKLRAGASSFSYRFSSNVPDQVRVQYRLVQWLKCLGTTYLLSAASISACER